jgi:mRNA interferase MazF
MNLRRGDIVIVDFNPTRGAEINKARPAIIVSNDVANRFSALITVVPLTSQKIGKTYPFEVLIENKKLNKTSKAKADQIRTLDKKRVLKKLGALTDKEITGLDQALRVHLNL